MLIDFFTVCLKISPLYLGAYFLLSGSFLLSIPCFGLYAYFVCGGLKKLYKDMVQAEKDRRAWYRSLSYWERKQIEEEQRFWMNVIGFGLFVIAVTTFGTSGEAVLNAELEASQNIIDQMNGRDF